MRAFLAITLCACAAWGTDEPRPAEQMLFGGRPEKSGVERPGEAELFGVEDAASVAPVEPATEPPPREDAIFGGESAPDSEDGNRERAAENPLTIGGRLYLRGQLSAARNVDAADWSLSSPWLVDGWFDARPTERVRGMLVARMRLDPTVDPDGGSSLFVVAPGPSIVLDQLWIRFDIARTVFVTAGQQHVKWGTGRFWNPTDYLHPARRDPLAVFDARTGATMLKLHVPVESLGWNFYGYALLDNPRPASTLGTVAGAARAEIVLGNAEFGVDAVLRRGRRPRLGVDVSAGVGPFDVYAEAAIRRGSDEARWVRVDPPDPLAGVEGLFRDARLRGWQAATTVGFSWAYQYSDQDDFAISAEYFFNRAGYEDPGHEQELYPWLLYAGAFTPFYLGKHYAGLSLLLPRPGAWNDTSIVATALGNLSDESYVARLDWLVTVLTNLRVEGFLAYHFGRRGGEFKLELDVPEVRMGDVNIPRIFVPAPIFEVGVGLRVDV